MTETLGQRPTKTLSPPLCKATWYTVQGTADIYWRAEMPAKHLGIRHVVMNPQEAHDAFERPNRKTKFPWTVTEAGANYPKQEGEIAVWTRPSVNAAIHAACMASKGIRCVAEVDDNYLSNPRQNIFMRQNNFDAAARHRHMASFASMDAIVFSTEWLRDEYHKTFKEEKARVPDLFVARNNVDLEDWRSPERTWSRTRVGIMGSHQHIWDWRLAAPALRLAKDMGAEIVFIGLDPGSVDATWHSFLGDYTHIPWLAPDEYHKTGLPLDIGLCPLVTNKHTMGKSDVKFLEYSMSGVATVAQNNIVYNRSIKHGETGLLAGGPDEMALAVHSLLSSPSRREALVAAAQQYVREERSIQVNLHEWENAIFQ